MNHKILLIDESAMLRRVAANILHAQPQGYDVFAATRAAEGFARACAGDVELILLDYQIAGFVDAELCRRLRAEPRTARIPSVLMVGQGIKPPPLASLPVNVVETLTKPIAPEQLSGVVNAIFDCVRTNLSLEEIRSSLHSGSPHHRLFNSLEIPRDESEVEHRQGSKLVSTIRDSRAVVTEQPAGFATKDIPTLKGNTGATSLRGVLRSISDTHRTGVLKLAVVKGEPTDVIFDRGCIVVVSTRDGEAYGARATEVMPAKVSPATLEEALKDQRETGTPFLLTLGTRGLLSKAAAVGLLRHFGSRHFARLWLQRHGPIKYEFCSLDALPGFALRLEPSRVSLDEWLLETTRHLRVDDVMASMRHEGTLGSPTYLSEDEENLEKLKLMDEEQKFLSLVDNRKGLPQIAESLSMTQEAAYLILYRFRCLEVLRYRPAPAAFVMTPRTNLRRVLPIKR